MGFAGGVLRHFEIVIPPGHAGLTGIALGYGHRGVIPYGELAFYSGDDDKIERNYTDIVPGVPWSAFLCNLDLQAHVWEIRFDLDELDTLPASARSAPIAPSDIIAAGNASFAGG